MLYLSDLQALIKSWTERLDSPAQPLFYKDALSECIYELNQVINKALLDEMTYEDYLSQEADSYLASIEAHEVA